MRWAARHFRPGVGALIGAAVIASTPANAQDDVVSALIQQDRRLAGVAERMLRANAPLCNRLMPLTGMIINSADQYHGGAGADFFRNGPLAITAVLDQSPAAQADLRPGDAIVVIGGDPVSTLQPEQGQPLRNAAFARLAQFAADGNVALTISRDGNRRQIQLPTPTGCRALVEILADEGSRALSDGRVIQVTYGLARRASDDELAVIFAHELGHLVLEHRRRLSAAGIDKGLLGEFGKNQRLNREVEVEADRISVHLLVNAGYDPAIAPTFWKSPTGRSVGGGLLRMSTTYPDPSGRAALMQREIDEYLGARAGFSWPGHLLARR